MTKEKDLVLNKGHYTGYALRASEPKLPMAWIGAIFPMIGITIKTYTFPRTQDAQTFFF